MKYLRVDIESGAAAVKNPAPPELFAAISKPTSKTC